MAFSYTLKKRGVHGNRKYKVYTLTDVQNDGTSKVYTGFKKISIALATNQSRNTDHFKESWNQYGGDVVTLTSVTNDDDGEMTVWGL
jgi:hypothetical protein